MQLNGKIFRGIRKVRTFWVSLLAIFFGLIFAGLGIYFLILPDQGKMYEKATATIVRFESETILEDINYYTIISYTDNENVAHVDIRLDSYSTSWKVGDEIEIKYNVDLPSDVKLANSSIVVPLAFIVLGSISTIVGIFVLFKTAKSLKHHNSSVDENALPDEGVVENVKDTKLFFHYSGKMNQSYTIEDELGKVLYECKLVKFNPFASNIYDFIDSKTGYVKQFKIGKTVTSSSSGGMILIGDMLSSGFKINGVNCWDYIHNRGYEVKHLLEGKTIIHYEVTKGDSVVADIVPANIKDPFSESKNFLTMGKGVYRLEIVDANLEDIVMIAFIISRTDMVE